MINDFTFATQRREDYHHKSEKDYLCGHSKTRQHRRFIGGWRCTTPNGCFKSTNTLASSLTPPGSVFITAPSSFTVGLINLEPSNLRWVTLHRDVFKIY